MTDRPEGYMQQHLCECHIDVAGEKLTILWKGEPDLIPWPEIRVLQEIHGEQSVYDIRPVAVGERETPLNEKERLVRKYGRDEVEKVYAGKSFHMEFFVPGWPINLDEAKSRKEKSARPSRKSIRSPEDELI